MWWKWNPAEMCRRAWRSYPAAWNAEDCMFAVCSGLLPLLLMVFFYTRNVFVVEFWPCMLNAAFISVLCLTVFAGVRFLFRSGELAFCGALLTVFFFFSYGEYNGLVIDILPFGVTSAYLLLLAGIFCLAAWLFAGKRIRFKPWVVHCLTIGTVALFLIQCGKALPVMIKSERLGYRCDWRPMTDPALPSPDIHWIHCDGMLGFDSFQTCYQDRQEEFQRFLEQNGFEVYRSASFNALRRTVCALPALMSPAFYDRYLGHHIDSQTNLFRFLGENKRIFDYHRLMQNELYCSFSAKGYRLHFPVRQTKYIGYVRERAELRSMLWKATCDETGCFFGYLNQWMPLSLFLSAPDADEALYSPEAVAAFWGKEIAGSAFGKGNMSYLSGCMDALEVESPKLVVYNHEVAHYPYIYDRNGNLRNVDKKNTDPENYPEQHRFSAAFLRRMITRIVESDPDAVIVVQADHGLHGTTEAQIYRAFGKGAVPADLWNHTISAVRVPLKYRNGNEERMRNSPLNISRYLINSFVGRGNYEYRN